MRKIILDLCGGTGSWSLPYKNAGYEVRNVTLPEYNVLDVTFWHDFIFLKDDEEGIPIKDIYGILAAPPCTMFSDARTNAKTPRDLRGGMAIVNACLEIIQECQYHTFSDQSKLSPLQFWALENPYYGRLKWFLGNPSFVFDPFEFGDPYKKRTAIWGYFKEPIKTHRDISEVMTKEQIEKHKTNSQQLPKFDTLRSKDIHSEFFGKLNRQSRRAITPRGFSEAFFRANQ